MSKNWSKKLEIDEIYIKNLRKCVKKIQKIDQKIKKLALKMDENLSKNE